MPNRIIREGYLASDAVNTLSAEEERFYFRLYLVVDDFGRFEARPELLRSRCYPLKTDSIRTADITRSLAACEKAGLVVVYQVDGRRYLQVEKFKQRTRTTSKCPSPKDVTGNASQMSVKCQSNARLDDVVCGDVVVVEGECGSRRAAAGIVEFPAALNTSAFTSAWVSWIQHRDEIRKKLTPLAIKKQFEQLEKLGVARAVAAINHSIANGYTGIYEPKDQKPVSDFDENGEPTEACLDRIQRTQQ